MINLYLEVLKKGQDDGVLNPNVRAGVLLDFMLGLVQRSFAMWIQRGQKGSLVAEANDLFEMVWRGITHPDHPADKV
ncbi:MAG: hypothetical protein P8X96_26020 [Desulfobacteraceae bacterium]